MSFEIIEGLPIPNRSYGKHGAEPKYPFLTMKAGQAFKVQFLDDKEKVNKTVSLYKAAKNAKVKITTRSAILNGSVGEITVWKVA